ncbi:hypothetical protein WME79_09125 [Sorangium sp. So ce726]|uniref:hypothetical protein n=1 Tax=Sorangium sp. So ce726 TaxID=3133319 RepID=UPI003F63C0EF
MRDQRAMLPALLVSALVHLGAWSSARLSPEVPACDPAEPAAEREPIDLWTGLTAALPGSGGATRPSDARGERDEAGERGELTSMPTARAPADASRPTAPAERQAEAGGEPAPPVTAAPRGHAAPRPNATPRPAERLREPAANSEAGAPARSAAARTSAGAGEDGEGDFGAVGVSAVRNLGRAFTRAIPPACQADPIWATLPPGSAGKARFVIDIDDAGHIATWRPEPGGEEPARHLSNLAKRTIALLGAGTFAVARGAVTAGKQTLEVSAVVRVGEGAGETGAPADLAWRFEGGRGKASFVQPGGRLVEVVVQVVRTEVARGAPPG